MQMCKSYYRNTFKDIKDITFICTTNWSSVLVLLLLNYTSVCEISAKVLAIDPRALHPPERTDDFLQLPKVVAIKRGKLPSIPYLLEQPSASIIIPPNRYSLNNGTAAATTSGRTNAKSLNSEITVPADSGQTHEDGVISVRTTYGMLHSGGEPNIYTRDSTAEISLKYLLAYGTGIRRREIPEGVDYGGVGDALNRIRETSFRP